MKDNYLKNAGPVWIRYEINLDVNLGFMHDAWSEEKVSVTQEPLFRGTIRIETDEKTYSPPDPEDLVQYVIDTELAETEKALKDRYGENNVKVWVESHLAGDIRCIKSLELERKGVVKRQWRKPTEEEKAKMRRLRNPPQPPRELITIDIDGRLLPMIDAIKKEKETEFGHISYVPERSRGQVIETLCKNAFKIDKWLKTQPWELQQRVAKEAYRKPLFEE